MLIFTAGFFLWSVVTTSSARVSATTESSGLLSSGTVTLSAEVSSANLLFDTDGLYPGLLIDGCVDIAYSGSLPGEVRLFGQPASTTGLGEFIEFELQRTPNGTSCAAPDTSNATTIFAGTLQEFWQQHSRWGTGLMLDSAVTSESSFALLATVELMDDNRAQGLTVDFTMTAEVRP